MERLLAWPPRPVHHEHIGTDACHSDLYGVGIFAVRRREPHLGLGQEVEPELLVAEIHVESRSVAGNSPALMVSTA